MISVIYSTWVTQKLTYPQINWTTVIALPVHFLKEETKASLQIKKEKKIIHLSVRVWGRQGGGGGRRSPNIHIYIIINGSKIGQVSHTFSRINYLTITLLHIYVCLFIYLFIYIYLYLYTCTFIYLLSIEFL